MRTLVLGGARSGKSAFGESLLDPRQPVRYAATARPVDTEMTERIRLHQSRRPPGWELVEIGADPAPAFADLPHGAQLLIDGLTLWLAGAMENGHPEKSFDGLIARMRRVPDLIVVSDEVGGGIIPDNPAARRFRDLAGELHQQVAVACDRVILVTAGLPMVLKGPPLERDPGW